MTNDLEQLMKKLQNHEEEKLKSKSDDRFITFKPGNTFIFRLLFIPCKPGRRVTPWIHNRTHNYTDPRTGEYIFEICPSSEYLMGNRGYNLCPLCKDASKYYEEFKKTNSKSADELFKLYGSVFNGFVPVFVINDPTKPENNGKVKIIRYGKTIKNYISKKVLGRDEKGKIIAGYTPIGSKAFDITSGNNLVITVTKPNEWNEYDVEFSNDLTSINVDNESLSKMCDLLKFDEDFMRDFNEQKLHELKQIIMREDSTPENKAENTVSAPTQPSTPTAPAPTAALSSTSPDFNKELEEMMKTI